MLPLVRLLLQQLLPDVSWLSSPTHTERNIQLTPGGCSVIKTFGFNTTITLVLTCPPFIVAGAAGIATGWSSGRLHERTWHITIGLTTAIVGFVIAPATLNVPARYVACFIFAVGAYSVNSVIIGWASSTLSQTVEKKAVRTYPLPVLRLSWPSAPHNGEELKVLTGCASRSSSP